MLEALANDGFEAIRKEEMIALLDWDLRSGVARSQVDQSTPGHHWLWRCTGPYNPDTRLHGESIAKYANRHRCGEKMS